MFRIFLVQGFPHFWEREVNFLFHTSTPKEYPHHIAQYKRDESNHVAESDNFDKVLSEWLDGDYPGEASP
jgi:hypothetical protein